MIRHTIFVSHAHADNEVCRQYVAALRAQGFDVWYDESNLQAGHSLTGEIEDELERRTAFVVMLTPAALQSYWVRLETAAFRTLAAEDGTRILLPVRLQSCAVPVLLRDTKWIDAINRPVDAVVAEIATTLGAFERTQGKMPQRAPALPREVLPAAQGNTRAPTSAGEGRQPIGDEELAKVRCKEGFLIVTPIVVKTEMRAPIGSRVIRSDTILISTITRIETKVIMAAIFGQGGGMDITIHGQGGIELRATTVAPLRPAQALVQLLESMVLHR